MKERKEIGMLPEHVMHIICLREGVGCFAQIGLIEYVTNTANIYKCVCEAHRHSLVSCKTYFYHAIELCQVCMKILFEYAK